MTRYFLNPWFLVGLAAVAVPVVIHLLTRDRVRRVPFSTLRFFAKVSRKVLRKKRFREMLLLAMRAAVFALLALAFARPLLEPRDDALAGAADTARVLLVDVSASMGRRGVPEALAARVRETLDGLPGGSAVTALMVFDDAARVVVPLTARLDEVRAALAAVSPGHGGTDVAEAVRRADAALAGAAARRKEIILFSDFQRAGWRRFKGDWKLGPDTRLVPCAVTAPDADDNVAIVRADYPASTAMDGQPRKVAARVENFSLHQGRDVEVTLSVAGRKVGSQTVRVPAGRSVPVSFRHVFDSPGDNPAVLDAAIVGTDAARRVSDAAPEDDRFYFNARVIPRIRVAVLSGPSSSAALLAPGGAGGTPDAAFFIEKALAPTPDSPFLVKRLAAAEVTPADLADVLVAVLADVKEVPAPVVDGLGRLLERGGGILFLPGQRVDAEVFNRVFGPIAPCRLRSILRPGSGSGETPGAVLTKWNAEHPVFEVFNRPHYGDLSLARFQQFWEISDSQVSQVIARFGDDRPAVVEREVRGGISMLLTSPVDLRWNNLALRAVFLPYLHETVRYLAVRRTTRTGYQIGETLPVAADRQVVDPRGAALEAGSAVAAMPGFYVARGPGGEEPFQFAVNRDGDEADPAAIDPEQIVAAVQTAEADLAEARQAASEQTDRRTDDTDLWWYVVLAVVMLSVAELFVANRTMRH